MAEDSDDSQKTEEPTQKKLDESRKKGQIANSREVNHWFMILAATIIVAALSPDIATGVLKALRRYIEAPEAISLDPAALESAVSRTFGEIGLLLAPMTVILVVAAISAGVVQSGFLLAVERLQPKLEKISLFKGLKRMFSMTSLVEFAKAIFKLAIVGTVVVMLLWPAFGDLPRLMTLPAAALVGTIRSLAIKLLIGVLAIMTIIMAIDFLYQRFRHMKQMRMSRREVREELKQSEGDPVVKGRIRQIRMERARRRMMAAVPKADAVITNPFHFAVALSYKPDDMSAPRVIAKGVDDLALRIREVAEEHGVPVVQDPPLARALYDAVDLDQEIPLEHYKAVAEVISYIWRVKGKAMPA